MSDSFQLLLIVTCLLGSLLVAAVVLLKSAKTKRLSSELEVARLTQLATELRGQLDRYKPIMDIEAEAASKRFELEQHLANTSKAITERQSELNVYDERTKTALARLEELELREEGHLHGVYQHKYEFSDITQFSEALELVREAEKALIKRKEAVTYSGGEENAKTFKDVAKLAVSAFNGEALALFEDVTPTSFERTKNQLTLAFSKINKQLASTGYSISERYLGLKQQELALVNEYRTADRRMREEQQDLKAAMREDEKARVEAEEARLEAIKEQEQYQLALEKARSELASKSGEERAKYEAKIAEWQKKFEEATAERERATAMAQITKKGHVYIVSNVGSFGENIFKIGMTRRKDPKERIVELGDASVPFTFDIHALVSVDDAPAVENQLHEFFKDRRVNLVNQRKEFFGVTIDEIAEACAKLGYRVQLTKTAEASEYRESIALRQSTEKKAA